MFLKSRYHLGLTQDAGPDKKIAQKFVAVLLLTGKIQLLRSDQGRLDQDIPQQAAILFEQAGKALDLGLLLLGDILQAPVLERQHILLKCQTDRQAQVFVIPWFGDEFVDRTFLDCSHDGIDVGMPGQHDADRLGVFFANEFEQFAAGHFRHAVVTYDQVHRFTLQNLQCFLGR